MFEFDAGKLIIIAIAALIFIGPKDLPRVMRQVGQAVGKLRRMGAEFQAQFMEAMNEAGAEDLKADVHKLTESAKIDLGFDPLHAAKSEMMSAVRQIEAPVKPVEAAVPAAVPEVSEESLSVAEPLAVARAKD
ncbi:twin-arginine translocase subunit TatB [uncultured Methylovirgula sp.]|uniref:Sec-independent protein translocase subunit TatA/TatB n=1 Tax=uncultured Methylovirgula sp. TaxID=1285960 RepID=UPI0026186344|nr:twin-arginine translocase subunit TatB [uncultured Methylovirgula sp.]